MRPSPHPNLRQDLKGRFRSQGEIANEGGSGGPRIGIPIGFQLRDSRYFTE